MRISNVQRWVIAGAFAISMAANVGTGSLVGILLDELHTVREELSQVRDSQGKVEDCVFEQTDIEVCREVAAAEQPDIIVEGDRNAGDAGDRDAPTIIVPVPSSGAEPRATPRPAPRPTPRPRATPRPTSCPLVVCLPEL